MKNLKLEYENLNLTDLAEFFVNEIMNSFYRPHYIEDAISIFVNDNIMHYEELISQLDEIKIAYLLNILEKDSIVELDDNTYNDLVERALSCDNLNHIRAVAIDKNLR